MVTGSEEPVQFNRHGVVAVRCALNGPERDHPPSLWEGSFKVWFVHSFIFHFRMHRFVLINIYWPKTLGATSVKLKSLDGSGGTKGTGVCKDQSYAWWRQ